MNRSIRTALLVGFLVIAACGCVQKGKKNIPEESMTAGHAVIGTADAIFHMAWKLSSAFSSKHAFGFY